MDWKNKMDFDISAERQTTMTCEPSLACLSFLQQHKKADERFAGRKNFIAATDGYTTWYSDTYASIERSGRNFVFIHEQMHGIFMHVKRTLLLKLRYGFVFPSLTNYAADAIINEGIIANPAMMPGLFSMPKEFPGVMMADIHSAVQEVIKLTGNKAPADYDAKAKHGQQMETIYSWLVWAKATMDEYRAKDQDPKTEKNEKNEKDGEGEKGEEGDSSPSSGQDDSPGDSPSDESNPADGNGLNDPADMTQIERMVGEPSWDMEEGLEQLEKLLESGETPSSLIDKINREIEEGRARIQSIVQGAKLAGTGAGNILLQLENDLPQAVIPWNRKLRKIVTRNLGTKMDDSYTRYGNATRSAIAMRQRVVPFTPGTTIFTERPRVLVVLDVSGSHINELNQCMSEIWSIAQLKGAAVDIITFDNGVQQKFEITSRADLRKILNQGLSGSGGTNLDGVFDDIAKMTTPYKACIIMTDGYLLPPKNPRKIAIMWMITAGGTSRGLEESGEVINLPDYGPAALSKKAA